MTDTKDNGMPRVRRDSESTLQNRVSPCTMFHMSWSTVWTRGQKQVALATLPEVTSSVPLVKSNLYTYIL